MKVVPELWERALAARRKENVAEVPFVKKTLRILSRRGALAYAEWHQWKGITIAVLVPGRTRRTFTVIPKSEGWAETVRGNPITPADVAARLTRDR